MFFGGAARKYKVWPCHGAKDNVAHRWKQLFATLRSKHPYVDTFASMSDSRLVSQFASMLSVEQRSRNAPDALKQPGVAEPPKLTREEAAYVSFFAWYIRTRIYLYTRHLVRTIPGMLALLVPCTLLRGIHNYI